MINVCLKVFILCASNSFSPLKMVEIAIPELHEMRTAHIVSIGSESLSSMNPDFEDGYEIWPLEF